MTYTFDHPDPDFVPLLKWGDPIPLLWHEAEEGAWQAWPPPRFRQNTPSGELLWSLGEGVLDSSFYKPDDPKNALANAGEEQRVAFGHDAPLINWGHDLPVGWNRYDDGRLAVHLASMRVAIPNAEIIFHHYYRDPNFYHPRYVRRDRGSDSDWDYAEYMGLAMGSRRRGVWRVPDTAGRWKVGQVKVGPSRLEFHPHGDLLPLDLPSADEIQAERESYLPGYALEDGQLHYLTMMVDMAASDEIMKRVGNDHYSRKFQALWRDHDMVRISDDRLVHFGSERNYGAILSTLRRYGETYMMYDNNWADPDPEIQPEIIRMLSEVGYKPI